MAVNPFAAKLGVYYMQYYECSKSGVVLHTKKMNA
jgi:hypothetical protein